MWAETGKANPSSPASGCSVWVTSATIRLRAGSPMVPIGASLRNASARVAHRSDLDEWAERLATLGVRHSPIADRDYGAVLCLRDPGEFQLELFYRDNHPQPPTRRTAP